MSSQKFKVHIILGPLLVHSASHLINKSRFLLAQALFNLDTSSASFVLPSLHPPGCGVSVDQINSVYLCPLELTYL